MGDVSITRSHLSEASGSSEANAAKKEGRVRWGGGGETHDRGSDLSLRVREGSLATKLEAGG